ncbi:MAG: sodium:calcium antiporter [Chloroflexi bacterium]|nr:sodium:calcium antiporter [Chloroflexota bacterium]
MGEWVAQQNLTVVIVLGLAALAILVASSEQAVKRLVGLAHYANLSTAFVGMTVVSLATSIPEITAHYTASVGILRGSLDFQIGSSIVLGANIGSDVIQQTLIMGIVVFFAGVLKFKRYFLYKSMIPMIGTTVMCIILGWDRVYSRLDGAILFGTFIAYTYYLFIDERRYYRKEDQHVSEEVPGSGKQAALWGLIALGAMVLTIGSAQIVLSITQLVVQRTGIGGSFVGVITLGVASALPEFITAVAGIRRHDSGIPLGTLVGSNITNPLVAIGGGALISTYWAPQPLLYWDLPWETVTGLALWAILWITKGKLNRIGAVYLILLYVAYITMRALFFLAD